MKFSGERRTVLLVEDEEAIRSLLVDSLNDKGLLVLEASDGEEALALASGHVGSLALVITDVRMPRMSGPEMVAKLAEARQGFAVLYMTGHDGGYDLHGPDPSGRVAARSVIEKPFEVEEFLVKVTGMMAAVL